jgi:hypothetical protein
MKVITEVDKRIRQGDVFRDIPFIEHVTEEGGVIEVSRIIFPLVVVLTQDCDLHQDWLFRWSGENKPTQDKQLLSVLVAPMYNAEHVFDGEHLSEIGMKMEPVPRKGTTGDYLRSNQRPRYHYIQFPATVPIVPSVIDFKHYFSVNVVYLKSLIGTNFVCSIDTLDREDILQRFASFLSRIAVPPEDNHGSYGGDGPAVPPLPAASPVIQD